MRVWRSERGASCQFDPSRGRRAGRGSPRSADLRVQRCGSGGRAGSLPSGGRVTPRNPGARHFCGVQPFAIRSRAARADPRATGPSSRAAPDAVGCAAAPPVGAARPVFRVGAPRANVPTFAGPWRSERTTDIMAEKRIHRRPQHQLPQQERTSQQAQAQDGVRRTLTAPKPNRA